MNSEQDPTELLGRMTDESVMTGDSKTGSLPTNSINRRPPNSSDTESDDAALAKIQTLLIDHPSGGNEQADFEAPSETFKYIQGVVQGPRVYIVTNLLGESEILFQSQMVWTIGRNREAALPLKDRVMSRRHAVLQYVQDVGFQLLDLNSMNGSFVNGVRIQQRQSLRDGDRIRLGSINFTFFVNHRFRTLDSIHPEVLARFNDSENHSAEFIDYSALEDPEMFKVSED